MLLWSNTCTYYHCVCSAPKSLVLKSKQKKRNPCNTRRYYIPSQSNLLPTTAKGFGHFFPRKYLPRFQLTNSLTRGNKKESGKFCFAMIGTEPTSKDQKATSLWTLRLQKPRKSSSKGLLGWVEREVKNARKQSARVIPVVTFLTPLA